MNKSSKNRNEKDVKHKTWEIQSQCIHNGEDKWTEERVKKTIKVLENKELGGKSPSLVRWAWCCHDKDTYLQENIDEMSESDRLTAKIGQPRPAHIHLVLEFEYAVRKSTLVKASKLEGNFIHPPKAKRDQFLAIATYLSHIRAEEQAKGKHEYPVEEIHCSKNFDYAREVKQYLATKDKKNVEFKKSPRKIADELIDELAIGKLNLEEVKQQEGFSFFLHNEKDFRRARTEYIKKNYEMKPRTNYYIFGKAGSGKSTMSRMLAKSLFPDLADDECYFTVGEAGVRFDNYEYQPIIIFEDIRADELLNEFKREGILNLMELNPKKRDYNKKFGSIILTHQVNIFTGPVPFTEFIDGLMGSYQEGGVKYAEDTDKEQAKRRFPVTVEVTPGEIFVYRNSRIFDGTINSDFKTYAQIRNVNIANLNKYYSGRAYERAFEDICKPLVSLHELFMQNMLADMKESDESVAPMAIQVVEGYEEVNSIIEKDKEAYHKCCESFLLEHILPGGEFGPYIPEEYWELGDRLDGKFAEARGPFSYENWITLGRPQKYEFGLFYGGYDEDDLNIRLHHHALEMNQLTDEWIEKKNSGEIMSQEDEAFYEMIVEDKDPSLYITNEELEAVFEKGEAEQDEDRNDIADFFITSCMYADKFFSSGSIDDLRFWLNNLADNYIHISNYISVYWSYGRSSDKLDETYSLFLKNWKKMKQACVQAHIIETPDQWYSKYQELNQELKKA